LSVNSKWLFQLGVLCLSSDEDGDVGVGAFRRANYSPRPSQQSSAV
jgi:hypothetical protein